MPAVRRTAATTGFMAAFALAGCATLPAPSPVAAVTPASYATIMTIRATAPAGGPDVRSSILGALGGPAMAQTGTPAVEFIVKEDNASQPISVVQPNADHMRPGERVMLIRGARTGLARPGVNSASASPSVAPL